jgi:hypothetical protein
MTGERKGNMTIPESDACRKHLTLKFNLAVCFFETKIFLACILHKKAIRTIYDLYLGDGGLVLYNGIDVPVQSVHHTPALMTRSYDFLVFAYDKPDENRNLSLSMCLKSNGYKVVKQSISITQSDWASVRCFDWISDSVGVLLLKDSNKEVFSAALKLLCPLKKNTKKEKVTFEKLQISVMLDNRGRSRRPLVYFASDGSFYHVVAVGTKVGGDSLGQEVHQYSSTNNFE